MKYGFAFLGLPLLVLACTPKVRPPDPVGTGGAGGAPATGTTTSSSGSSTGAGGGGGSSPIGSCTKSGVPFDIMGAADLPAGTQLANQIYLVPDLEKRAMVHVVVDDPGLERFLVRTVFDDTNPVGPLAVFSDGNLPGFHPQIGWAASGQLSLHGQAQYGLVRVDIPVDPDQGVGTNLAPAGIPVPVECSQTGHIARVAFARDGDAARYLMACPQDPGDAGPAMALLYAGDTTAMPTLIATDDPGAPIMRPDLYTFVDGTSLVTFSLDSAGNFFSYGITPQELAKLQPFKLTAAPSVAQGLFAIPPLAGDTGVAVLSAFFDKDTGKGQFWAGPVVTKDFGSLSQTPPPSLGSIAEAPVLAEVAPLQNPTWDATGIYTAGATQDKSAVRFSWLQRDGKPLVFAQQVYLATMTTVVVAGAAPLGDFTRLVVWIEQSAGPPTQYLVRGQKLICQIKS
jgi:hypothetical protein